MTAARCRVVALLAVLSVACENPGCAVDPSPRAKSVAQRAVANGRIGRRDARCAQRWRRDAHPHARGAVRRRHRSLPQPTGRNAKCRAGVSHAHAAPCRNSCRPVALTPSFSIRRALSNSNAAFIRGCGRRYASRASNAARRFSWRLPTEVQLLPGASRQPCAHCNARRAVCFRPELRAPVDTGPTGSKVSDLRQLWH
jgi:hypothetical protein